MSTIKAILKSAADGTLHLPEIGIDMPLAELYAGTALAAGDT